MCYGAVPRSVLRCVAMLGGTGWMVCAMPGPNCNVPGRSSSCPAPPLGGHISLPSGTTITRSISCAAPPLGVHSSPSSCSTLTRSTAPITVPPPCTYTPPSFGNTHTRLTPAPLSDAHTPLYSDTSFTWSTLTPRLAPPLGNQLCPDAQSSNCNALFGVLLGPWPVLIADTTLTWCTLRPRAASPGIRLPPASDSALPQAPPTFPASPTPCTSPPPDARTQPTAGSAKALSLSSRAPCAAAPFEASLLSIPVSLPTLSVPELYVKAPSGVLCITKQTQPTPAHCPMVSSGARPPSNSVTARSVSVPAACPMVSPGAHFVITSVAPHTQSTSTHRTALSRGTRQPSTCATTQTRSTPAPHAVLPSKNHALFTPTSPQTLHSPVRCAVFTLGTHPQSTCTSTPTRSTLSSCTSISPRPSVRRHRRRATAERPRVLVLLSSNVRLRVTPAPAPGARRAAMVPPSPPAPHSGPQLWTPSRAAAALHSAPNTKCMCTRKTATRTAKCRRCGKLARVTLSGVRACGAECPGRPVFPGPILVPGSERTLVSSP
ncbi:uncharacterized protein PB18E9.04c-like isoform X1 [Amphibalanus amphitrite]|uniref:uncharacterized protein PB18E9.04c-like isoform X1 n=1 Tax=Amphibalanus amphitrite TaxID=1232801 RepID=UPI001C90A826|nr:uncharacterized protein PB18E9.04c-like isoform X1 [Amphibalanus amphitrite]